MDANDGARRRGGEGDLAVVWRLAGLLPLSSLARCNF